MSAYDADAQEDADIVLIILRRVIALVPDFSRAIAGQVEAEMRAAYGGQRLRIPKRSKHLTAPERAALFQDGLTAMPTEEILRKHRISRATLFREMKRGGRFGG